MAEAVAGRRVQIIKSDPVHTGVLEFGTELIGSADNSIIALLGASPGASTSAFVALQMTQDAAADPRCRRQPPPPARRPTSAAHPPARSRPTTKRH
jgi:L-2-hydroxyglutarate oxidase LhgO